MKYSFKRSLSLFLFALVSVTASRAAVLEQTASFSHNQFFDTADKPLVMPVNYLTATFQPFDSSLGTLQSFTIAWTLKVQWDYVIGQGGNSTVSGSVNSILGGVTVTGSGGGNGYSVPGSGTREINPNTSVTFTVGSLSQLGLSAYNVVTGASSFTAVYDNNITADLILPASVDVRVTATAVLTYVYAAAVPEPSTYALAAGAGALVLAGVRRRVRNAR